MGYSINSVGAELRQGELTPAEVLALFKGNLVSVDGMEPPDTETATWDELEDYGAAGHGLDHDLANAGATENLIWEIMAEIDRARKEGRTL